MAEDLRIRPLTCLRPYRWPLALALVLGLLDAGVTLAQPLAVRELLDAVAAEASLRDALLVLVALFVAEPVLAAGHVLLLGRVAEHTVYDIRTGVVGRLLRIAQRELDRRDSGDLVSRATTDAALLRSAVSAGLVTAFGALVALIGSVVVMAMLDLLLFALTLAVVLLGAGAVLVASMGIHGATVAAQAATGALGARLQEALSKLSTVRASGATERELERAERHAAAAHAAGLRLVRIEAVMTPITALAAQGAFVAVLTVGGARVASGAMPVADLIAFLLYIFIAVLPLALLAQSLSAVQQARGALSRIGDAMALEVESADGRPLASAPRDPIVEFRGVSFGYRHDVSVLRNVDLTIPAPGLTAVVGPSGAGKSTLLALVERFHDPDEGTIRFAGDDITTIRRAELRRRVGLVEQDAPLLAGTLRDNITYANPEAGEDEIARVVALCRLEDVVAALPGGLDADVGEGGGLLSGGERQRVAIARALLADPWLVLLDEPTSQLDALNERALRDVVAELAAQRAVVVIAHRLSTVTRARQIIVLRDGAVEAVGAHGRLLAASPTYRRYCEEQLIATEPELEQVIGGDDL